MALTRVRNLRRFLTDSLDGIADPTLVSDTDGQLRFRNRAAVNYFRRTWRCARRASAVHPVGAGAGGRRRDRDGHHRLRPRWARSRPGAWRPGTSTSRCRTAWGTTSSWKCAPIRTDKGVFAGTVITLSDITAIRQAERKREEIAALRLARHARAAEFHPGAGLPEQRRGPTRRSNARAGRASASWRARSCAWSGRLRAPDAGRVGAHQSCMPASTST